MEGILKSITALAQTKIKSKLNKEEAISERKYSDAILEDIKDVAESIKSVQEKFNFTNDDDLIESLIYEERALKSRYSYLIKQARLCNISLNE